MAALGILLFTCIQGTTPVHAYWAADAAQVILQRSNVTKRLLTLQSASVLPSAQGQTYKFVGLDGSSLGFFVSNGTAPSVLTVDAMTLPCANRATTNARALNDAGSFSLSPNASHATELAFQCSARNTNGEVHTVSFYRDDANRRNLLMNLDGRGYVTRKILGAAALPQGGNQNTRTYKFDFGTGLNAVFDIGVEGARSTSLTLDGRAMTCTSAPEVEFTVLDRLVVGN